MTYTSNHGNAHANGSHHNRLGHGARILTPSSVGKKPSTKPTKLLSSTKAIVSFYNAAYEAKWSVA